MLCHVNRMSQLAVGVQAKKALHDTDDGAVIIWKVLNGSDVVGSVEEGVSVSGSEYEQAHQRHRWPVSNFQ